MFFITKIRQLETLKHSAEETVIEHLDKSCEVEDLEIPGTLKEDLKELMKSQWTKRWQRKCIQRIRDEKQQLSDMINRLTLSTTYKKTHTYC